MSDLKIETVQSESSGVAGRAVSHARGQRLVLDSSTAPKADALTNSEAFLAGVSSCGVTLIELHAQQAAVPLRRTRVTIEGARTPAEPRFQSVTMRFELEGVDQPTAEQLVEAYKGR